MVVNEAKSFNDKAATAAFGVASSVDDAVDYDDDVARARKYVSRSALSMKRVNEVAKIAMDNARDDYFEAAESC
jgi:hypothetical protein